MLVIPNVLKQKYGLVVCWVASGGGVQVSLGSQIDSTASAAIRSPYQSGEEGAEMKGDALDLLVDQDTTLTSGPELWVRTQRTRSQIEQAKTSVPRRVTGLRVSSWISIWVTQDEFGKILLHMKTNHSRKLRCPGCPSGGGCSIVSDQEETPKA